MTAIDIPDSVQDIYSYAFCGCSNLSDIKLSNGLTEIDMDVFQQVGATNIVIPDGVTYLSLGAFSFCDNLKSIVIPSTVTSIDSWAFQGDTALTDVYYGGTKEDWTEIGIGNTNEWLTSADIHYNAIGISLPQISGISFVSASSSVGGSIQVNLTDTEYDSTMITAFYKDGILVDIQTTLVSANDAEKIVPVTDTDADTAKIMIWSSFDSMKPLCEVETVDLTEVQ